MPGLCCPVPGEGASASFIALLLRASGDSELCFFQGLRGNGKFGTSKCCSAEGANCEMLEQRDRAQAWAVGASGGSSRSEAPPGPWGELARGQRP